MKSRAARVDRKVCPPVCFLVISTALGKGTPVHLLPLRGPALSVTQSLQVQAAPKHGAPSLRATNTEQRVEFVDTS